jgi:hypothetical protein
MSEDTGQTLNQDPSNDGLGASSSPDQPHYSPDGLNVVSTVEDLDDIDIDDLEKGADKPSEGTLKTDEGQTKSGGDAADDKNIPFHEHPRWKEVMAERDAARAEILNMKNELQQVKQTVTKPAQEDKKLPYTDVTQVEDEKLIEWFNDNPKQFMANLYSQMRHEMRQELDQETGQKKVQDGVRRTMDSYREKNPDFDDMWKKGEIHKFMDENPGHNFISAHQMLVNEKRVAEAVEKARKEERENIIKQVKAKRHASVLGSGPAVSSGPAEKELTNTKQKGGLTSVLADRLAQMRRRAS